MVGLLLMLAGCFGLSETSEKGMVGRVLDADGRPVVGLRLDTIETRAVTDGRGAFSIHYKEGSPHINFMYEGLFYRRSYQSQDLGKTLTLRLPEHRSLPLSCALERDCDLFLEWDLGGGFTARLRTPCADADLSAVPKRAPSSVRCQAGPNDVLPLHYAVQKGVLRVGPPQRPVRVVVRGVEQLDEGACQVRLGEQAARPTRAGEWSGAAAGPALATVSCGGRPGLPVLVGPSERSVVLDWSSTGPLLDLEPLQSEGGPLFHATLFGAEWQVELPVAQGVVQLPPLTAGVHHLLLRPEPGGMGVVPPSAEPPSTGVLWVSPLTPPETGFVGTIQLGEDLGMGSIPLRRLAEQREE